MCVLEGGDWGCLCCCKHASGNAAKQQSEVLRCSSLLLLLCHTLLLLVDTRAVLCCAVARAGDTTIATDPYFPFEDAVDVWGRTFAALGINYQGSVMTLDLCDRQGKYSNGFCHWPQVCMCVCTQGLDSGTYSFMCMQVAASVWAGADDHCLACRNE